jgi:hypothetical protein
MTAVNPMEKCAMYITKIRSNGFLNYFLIQFTMPFNFCEITKSDENHRWVNDGTNFKIVKGLHWSTISNSLIADENLENIALKDQIEEMTFLTFFCQNYAIPLNFKNVQKYIQITRDEFKNAWFIDKNRQIIYFKFRQMCGEGSVKRTYFGWNITENNPVAVYQINLIQHQKELKRCLNEKRIAEIKKSPYLLTIH